MISDESFVEKLITENLTQALSEVKYQNDQMEEWLLRRHLLVKRVINLPAVKSEIQTLIYKLIVRFHTADEKNWLVKCVSDPSIMIN